MGFLLVFDTEFCKWILVSEAEICKCNISVFVFLLTLLCSFDDLLGHVGPSSVLTDTDFLWIITSIWFWGLSGQLKRHRLQDHLVAIKSTYSTKTFST